MVSETLIASIVFLAVIALIISRKIDEVSASIFGTVLLVILLASYTVEEAFSYIDWDILGILLGMWMITGYMIKGGLADAVVSRLIKITDDYRKLIVLLAITAGFLSILVDNVLVILLFGSITLEIARKAKANPILAVLLVGFSANFMGTALLMGDLPPQLLHKIAGAEFIDFIVWQGKLSSFPLLTITFLIVTYLYYRMFLVKEPNVEIHEEYGSNKTNKLLLVTSILFFIATVIGMALRPMLGVPLGFITISGASALALTIEILKATGRDLPGFEEIVADVEWRALLFYASLFTLVGALEVSGVLERIAESLVPYLTGSPLEAYTVSYWMVAALSTFVEHDALLMTFLFLIKEAAITAGFDPGHLYWGMAWSATLASNMTTAAAPALYVAVVLLEKEGYKVTGKTFLKYSIPYILLSLIIHYIVTVTLWL
ncbi:MAG: permease [Desulfurococcales archaeon]|nr:permease [Desulfurococcales archaeon]